MKYYLIVGEASGDLHASHLMRSLQKLDPEAEFRFFGGDNMIAVGGTCVRHYKTLAYMGFVPVLMHLRTITKGMKQCKKDILDWQPDVVIPVDYADFNLNICKFLKKQKLRASNPTSSQKGWNGSIFYYISPKIWAWKEYRIKNFKRDVDEMFSILPFEVDFFEKRHNYPIHYVGNPTADEVREFRSCYKETPEEFRKRNRIPTDKPIIAIMPGSRKQEIKDNLLTMLTAARLFHDYQPVLACAPGIEPSYYAEVIPFLMSYQIGYAHVEKYDDSKVLSKKGVKGSAAYALLSQSTAALVTSGTATLETALFDVPQVVCYKTPVPDLIRWAFNHIIKCKYISLVNLIADKEIVKELFADLFSEYNIADGLNRILPGGKRREALLKEYEEVHKCLGNQVAPDNAAKIMIDLLNKKKNSSKQ